MKLTQQLVQPIILTLENALAYKVTITDIEGIIIGSSDLERINQFHPSAYEILCDRQPIESWDVEKDSYVNLPEGVRLGLGEKIIFEGECIGLIGLIGPPEEIRQSLKTAQLLIRLILDKKKSDDELRLIASDKKAFFLSILQGVNDSNKAWMAERAVDYGISLSIPRCAITVQTRFPFSEKDGPLTLSRKRQNINRMIHTIFNDPNDIIYEYDNGEVVILTVSGLRKDPLQREQAVKLAVDRLYGDISNRYSLQVLIGIGVESADHKDIPLSLRQARTAARIGSRTGKESGIYYFTKMRLGRIVAEFSYETRSTLQKDIIDKLQVSENESLIETLCVYFQMNTSVAETAKKLFIHRNTLQYRFRRIKEITGFDVYSLDDLIQLRLAILQYQYFQDE